MKEKIKEALKTTYAKLGLSDEAFDGVAALLEKTVTEESQIATAVSGGEVQTLLKTIQGNVDSWKNKFYDTDKKLNDYKLAHPDGGKESPKEGNKEDDTEPEWAKAIRTQNEQLLARMTERDNAEKNSAALARIKEVLKKQGCVNDGILNLTLDKFALEEKESEDDAAKRLKAKYDSSYTAVFGNAPIPPAGGGGGEAKPDYKSMVESLRGQDYLPKEETK